MANQELLIYGLAMGAAGTTTAVCFPVVSRLWMRLVNRLEGYQQARIQKASRALEENFMEMRPTWLKITYGVGPLVGAALLYMMFDNAWLACVGLALGLVLPDAWVRRTRAVRKRRFQAQLVDALFILSSSLKAGLSLTQAFEALESEMPPPASQEFGLMVKAHRLGESFEEALQRLNVRMSCEELNLIITAVLVARETGGDVTAIMGQLVTAIREKKKLNDKVTTLTLQGRLQAYVMSVLPVLFAMFIRTFNPRYFDLLLQDRVGNILLAVAVGLWVIGMALLFRLSRLEV